MKISLRLSMGVLPVLALRAAAGRQAWADTVVADNQIVQGSQCIGPTCANGENMTGAPLLFIKAPDTPGLRLLQAGGSFGSQVWDVEGNEGNFFVKDSTDGGTLPFRIR